MPGTVDLREAPLEAGAKAFNLGRMLRAGLRVPEGVCVLGSLDAPGWPRMAVRSSSFSEDGRYGSAAGQFLTLLNVPSEGLAEAVERVSSGLTGAVIVQPMVEARVAGVVFTRDPTGGSGMRVEATPGLGDALVSGHVRPAAWRDRELLDGPACLTPAELEALLRAAEQARELLGSELDLEFAFDSSPEPWLLQARPITASQSLREELRAREVERLRACGETVWSGYNVAETLPAPLPMSWSLVRRMMSLQGAYGRLYPELGYDPDPALYEVGVLDLICGRPYVNLSRSARLFFQDFPFVFRLAEFRADPRRAASPQPRVDLQAARPGFWRRLPSTVVKMLRAQFQLERQKKAFPRHFRETVLPAYLARLRSLETLPARERFDQLLTTVVDEFAGQSLKASAFAALAAQGRRSLPAARPSPTVELLQRAAAGEITFDELLEGMGHRGPAEMELAEPRWLEMPERLRQELAPYGTECTQKKWIMIHEKLDHGPLADWLALRETARHYLMLGWAELRRALLELDPHGGVFWLHYDELDLPDPGELIARRRLERRLLLSLPCPTVLFSDDLEAIGRTVPVTGADMLAGTGLSWGVAEGPALVVRHPSEVPPEASGYVLVCPSTDPGYTLAMSRAVALVVETGGVLSHGAIVARELGLPAVSNVPMGALSAGSRVRVDGAEGRVIAVAPPP